MGLPSRFLLAGGFAAGVVCYIQLGLWPELLGGIIGFLAMLFWFADHKPTARQRARRRLLASLSFRQRWQFRLLGRFWVNSSTGTRWRITAWAPSCIEYDLHNHPYRQKFCIHFYKSNIPVEDKMLALALMLRTNEKKLRSIAPRTRGVR